MRKKGNSIIPPDPDRFWRLLIHPLFAYGEHDQQAHPCTQDSRQQLRTEEHTLHLNHMRNMAMHLRYERGAQSPRSFAKPYAMV